MNLHNIETYFKHMCRTCMCTDNNLGSIFDCVNDEGMCIQEMLNVTTPQLCIQATDQLPKRICACCMDKMRNVYCFQQMCLYSDKRIRSLLSRAEGDFGNVRAFSTAYQFHQVHDTGNGNKTETTESDPLLDGAMMDIKNYLKLEQHDERETKPANNHQEDKQRAHIKPKIARSVHEEKKIYENVNSDVMFISENSDSEYSNILINHKRRNSIDKRYACSQCNKRFTSQSHLKRHERNLHSELIDTVEVIKDQPDITSNNIVLPGQMRKDHNCEHCNKKFKKLYSLKRHIQIHKDLFSNTSDNPARKERKIHRPYVCKYCKKAFQQSCTLKDHIRTHTGEQPFLCSECGRAFNSSSNMKQHLLRHTGVKRYECPDCPKKFPCLSDLASHKAVHKKVKPHVCDICGACFGKPYQLKKHKMYHNGEKPHKCEYCEMRFVCVDHMKRHMRTHTGEKPYKCKYCDRAFAQSNDLVKHLRSHLGENVYRCELCPRGFRLAAELREHFSEHKNDNDQTRKKHLSALREEEAKLKLDLHLRLVAVDRNCD